MDFIKTRIDGVMVVEPKVFGDHRGFFIRKTSVFRLLMLNPQSLCLVTLFYINRLSGI